MVFFSAEEVELLRSNDRAEIAALRAELTAILHDPLRAREQRARLILDEMDQSVVLLDIQGRAVEVNRSLLTTGGDPREQHIGKSIWRGMQPASAVKALEEAIFSVITTATPRRFELEVILPSKSTEPMVRDYTLKPLRNPQGEVIFVLLEARDITQRKRAEQEVVRKNTELQELYEQIRKLDQLKSMFFAMMNHELRTPLTLILGPTEALLQQPALEVRQALEIVTRNGRLLLKLVNDLLEVSRLEQGELELHYATCDLSQVVRGLSANFALVAEQRHMIYQVHVPEHLWGEVDSARIERVLLNLLSNAFKFTPDGGSIICTLSIDTASQIVLTVQDSGPGVPAEMRELIFERFRQTEEGARRRFGGTGLGLAIAKDLITLHGGTIQVDEAPGGGARFTIRLPQHAPAGTLLRIEEEATPSAFHEVRMSQATVEELLPILSSSPALPTSTGKTDERSLILVVEDHAQMRQFVVTQLCPCYRIAEAANGQEGLTLAQQLHPDLILTDLMMPVMSGEEMVAALRADPGNDDILIMVLSARGNDALLLNLLRGGAQDYLVKPFSSEELHARLGNLLTLQRTRRLLQQELASSQQDLETLVRTLASRGRELIALNTELQQMNKQQNDFIAVISHEFRTALAGIQGFSELLCKQECSAEEVKEYASDITADARRLARLIDEVLDLERMKSGKTVLNREPVEMNALLSKLARQIQQTTSQHTLVCVLDETLPLIQVDQDKVIQVISNLLSNAVKYSPAGGEIVLRSQRKQDAIQISIQDHGIGIPQDAQKDIFVPYSRIASAKTRYISGSGLGLSVVQEIIRLHGGTIWVESTVGHGSTFSISLPTPQQTLQPLLQELMDHENQI